MSSNPKCSKNEERLELSIVILTSNHLENGLSPQWYEMSFLISNHATFPHSRASSLVQGPLTSPENSPTSVGLIGQKLPLCNLQSNQWFSTFHNPLSKYPQHLLEAFQSPLIKIIDVNLSYLGLMIKSERS